MLLRYRSTVHPSGGLSSEGTNYHPLYTAILFVDGCFCSLNKFLAIPKFKMETPESIRASLRKGEWVTQEVRTQTISEVRLPGLPLFTRFGSCEAHATQVDQTSGDVPSPLLEVCYQCKDSYVHHWIACINREDCKIGQDAYETFSVASQNSLEISDASGHRYDTGNGG